MSLNEIWFDDLCHNMRFCSDFLCCYDIDSFTLDYLYLYEILFWFSLSLYDTESFTLDYLCHYMRFCFSP